jgi:hypothetical protein
MGLLERLLWYGDEERSIAVLPGIQNAEYRAHLILAWLKKNHNEHCSHINRGDWKTVKEDIRRAAYWRRDKEAWIREHYPLTSRLLKRLIALYRRTGRIWSAELFEKANHKRRLEARARIAEAICSLEDEGIQISIAEVARRAKSDWRTVKKNWDLMAVVLTSDNLEENRSLETETNRNHLACSGGVNSLGGQGGRGFSDSVSSDSEKEFSPVPEMPLETPLPHVFIGCPTLTKWTFENEAYKRTEQPLHGFFNSNESKNKLFFSSFWCKTFGLFGRAYSASASRGPPSILFNKLRFILSGSTLGLV